MSVRDVPFGWPEINENTVFDYSFVVWPDETSPRMRENKAVFVLFNQIMCRAVMEFTTKGFNDFAEELAKVGLTLREVERVPHFEPQGVF